MQSLVVNGNNGSDCAQDRSGNQSIQVLSDSRETVVGTLAVTTTIGRDNISITNNHYASSASAGRYDAVSLRELRQWIKAPDFTTIYQTLLAKRMEKTGTWFLNSEEFQRLVEGTGCILWATGMPGAGKSVLASLSTEHLLEAFVGQEKGAVVFAFIQYTEKHSTRDILASFLEQLVLSSALAYNYTSTSFSRMRISNPVLMEKDVVSLLRHIVSSLEKVFVVLDGLDEAGDDVKDGLLNVLPTLGVNLLMTSRPLDLYVSYTPGAVFVSIEARTEDIEAFVVDRLQRNARLRSIVRGRPDLVHDVCSLVKKKSEGMFILAYLQMEAVRSATSSGSLLRLLDEQPAGLQDMYAETLRRIDAQYPGDVDIAHRVFIWLLYGPSASILSFNERGTYISGPLTMKDVQAFLSVSFNHLLCDFQSLIPVEVILSTCGGLITVIKGEVRFIHFSAHEFMKNVVFADQPNPHTLMSVAYLVYLRHHRDTCLSSGPSSCQCPSRDAIDCARRRWGLNARLSQKHGRLHPFIVSCLGEDGIQTTCTDVFFEPWRRDQAVTGLCLAAMHGLVDAIAAKIFPCARTESGFTAFHLAIIHHQVDALRELMLSYGQRYYHCRDDDDVQAGDMPAPKKEVLYLNVQDASGRTPLMLVFLASRQNLWDSEQEDEIHLEMLKLMLSHSDLDVEPRDDMGRSAFWYACSSAPTSFSKHQCDEVQSSTSRVELLLSVFPTLPLTDQIGDIVGTTPLMLACVGGLQPIILRLVNDLKAHLPGPSDSRGENILMKVCQGALLTRPTCANCTKHHGKELDQILTTLLSDLSLDVNQRNDSGTTASMYAVASRLDAELTDVVARHLLRSPTVDINARDEEGNSALFYAMGVVGPQDIWSLGGRNPGIGLLDSVLSVGNLDVKIRNQCGESALHVAYRYVFLGEDSDTRPGNAAGRIDPMEWTPIFNRIEWLPEDFYDAFNETVIKSDMWTRQRRRLGAVSLHNRLSDFNGHKFPNHPAFFDYIIGRAFSNSERLKNNWTHDARVIVILAHLVVQDRCDTCLRIMLHHLGLLKLSSPSSTSEYCTCRSCSPLMRYMESLRAWFEK